MFFVLSKVVGFFAQPSNVLIVLGIAGALLSATRFARAGRRVMIASLVLLALVGLSPLGNILLLPLEQRFPPWVAGQGAPDGIIVLGGAVDEIVAAERGVAALNDAAERMTAAVALSRRYPNARLLFSGGSAALTETGVREADAAALVFRELGVGPERIESEGRSRNTVENARFTKELADPKPGQRWLLVTSAYHMPRSIGVFRAAGFAVEPYPIDWRTRGGADVLRPFGTLSDGLRRTDLAMHEWIGLLMYRLAGYTAELFPGPSRVAGCDTAPISEACRR